MRYIEDLIFFDDEECELLDLPEIAPVDESLELLFLLNDEKLNLQQELGQLVLWGADSQSFEFDTGRTVISDRLFQVRGLQAQLSDIVVPLLIGELTEAANQTG